MQELRASEFFTAPQTMGLSLEATEARVRSLDLLPGLTVSLVSLQGRAAFSVAALMDSPGIHFSYLLDNPMEVGFRDHRFRWEAGTPMTSFAPGERFHMHFPATHRNVEVVATPDALRLLAGEEDYHQFAQALSLGSPLRRGPGHGPARAAAERLAALMAAPLSRHLTLHAAAVDFLAWQVGALVEAPNRPEGEPALSPRDVRLIMAARDRLVRDLAQPPTIAALAREIGLNELKLKRGFKALFGCGVHALFQRARMDEARILLRRHGVTETAMRLGYSNMSHFSAAFRRQFGVLPSAVRRGE